MLKKEYNRGIFFILNKIEDNGSFGSVEDTFWSLTALYLMKNLEPLNVEKLNKYVFNFRSPKGGFYSKNEEYPDVRTTFFAISILHLLNLDLNEDEKKITYKFLKDSRTKDGLFLHCKDPSCECHQKPSFLYTFFAVASIISLNFLEKLESEFFEKLTNMPFNIFNFDTFFFFLALNLLNIEIKLEEVDFLKIINFFQRDSGGFGRIQDSFWVITWLNSHHNINKINKGAFLEHYIKSCQKSDGGYNEEGQTVSNLKVTAQAIILLSLLNPLVVKDLENEIFSQLSKDKLILIKRISDQFSVDEDLITSVLSWLNSKYKWLKLKLLNFESVFNKYLEKLSAIDQNIGKIILKSIYSNNIQKIDLMEVASSLNVNEEEVIRVIYDLIDYSLIYGNIETAEPNKEFHILNINYVPKNFIKRNEILPFDDIQAEMETFNVFKERVGDFQDNVQKLPNDFRESIEYLLDIDETELANLKVDRLINSYIIKIKSFDEEIENLYSQIDYFKSDAIENYEIWKKVSASTLVSLKNLKEELLTKISSKLKIITAYNELESFVNFVNENIEKFKNKIEIFTAIFYKTCSRNELTLKKQEFIDYLESLDEDFKNITKYIQNKSKELVNVTKKIKLFKNVIISEDPSFGKGIISSDLKKKLQPFDIWLKNQWDQKRNDSFKKITEFKSKIHKHDELVNYINEADNNLKSQLKIIENLEDHEQIYSKTVQFIQSIAKTDQYISNFIRDTNKIIENFDLVAQDISTIWSAKVNQFGEKIQYLKEKIGKKIIDLLEIKKKNEFEENIENHVQTFLIKVNEIDKIQNMDWKKINISYRELLNTQLSLIKQSIFEKNEQILKIYRENSKKFSKFVELSEIALRKWENFYQAIDESLNKKEDFILNVLLVKTLFELSTARTGGRVQLKKLSTIMGLEENIVQKRLKVLEENFKIEINFIDSAEVIPLTDDNKTQLKFEEFTLERSQAFKESFDRISRFFQNISDRKKIIENEEEIKNKLTLITEQLVNFEVELRKNFSIQIKNEYNKQMISNLNEIREKLKEKLNNIESIMNKRNEYDDLAKIEIYKIHKKFDEISNFTNFEDLKAFEDFNNEIINFNLLITNFNKSSDEFISESCKIIENFDKFVYDLKNKYQSSVKKLASDLSILNYQKNRKINVKLVDNLKNALKTKIEDLQTQFHEYLFKLENELFKIKKKKEIESLNQTIKDHYIELNEFFKNSDKEINDFIKMSEEKYKLINLKYRYEDVLKLWNIEEIKEGLIIYLSLFL